MGRWFPGRRKGNREQVREFDKAQRDLNQNSDREGGRRKVRDETPRYRELNHRVNEAARPLSRFQQSRDARDFRMAREDRRAAREQRRADRGRGAR